MKLSIVCLILFFSHAGICQDIFDNDWPKLNFEKDSKLAIHKKKAQTLAYANEANYRLGDTILFTVEINRAVVENWDDFIHHPTVKHLGSSRSIQYGTTSKEQRYSWAVYRVKYLAISPGEVQIDPIPIQIEGKAYETKEVKINIEE